MIISIHKAIALGSISSAAALTWMPQSLENTRLPLPQISWEQENKLLCPQTWLQLNCIAFREPWQSWLISKHHWNQQSHFFFPWILSHVPMWPFPLPQYPIPGGSSAGMEQAVLLLGWQETTVPRHYHDGRVDTGKRMAPIKTVSTIMQNTAEWINLLPGVKAASTKLAVKRHAFILPAASCQILRSPCALRMITGFLFPPALLEQGEHNQLMSLHADFFLLCKGKKKKKTKTKLTL